MSLADTLLWLCQTPSPIGEERQLCDALVRRLEQSRLAAPIRRYGDSVVVPLVRGKSGPHVVLFGHLDVVRTSHDQPARIEDNRLYGPGAADMKSGLALMLDLAEASQRPDVNLSLIFYAREEGPYDDNELGPVLAQDAEIRSADFAVALEPSDNKLQLGCGGSVHVAVRFRGKTAHSARPWQGDNAIHRAANTLQRLAELPVEAVTVDGLSWANVTSATMAQGGRAPNIIPDLFELNVNRRFGPDRNLDQVLAELEALLSLDADLEFVDKSPAAPPLRNHKLIQLFEASGALAVEPKQAWTDVARFAQLGIPAVNFGPGVQAQAHQRNEWTYLDQLELGKDILNRWLTAIARGS